MTSAPVRRRARHAEHRGVLDGRDVLDAQPGLRVRRRCPPRVSRLEVRGLARRSRAARRRGPRRARAPSTPISSRPSRTTNGTTSSRRVERSSSARAAGRAPRERRPPEHERPMVGVLELRVAVDPAVDADVARARPASAMLDRLGDRRPSARRRAAGPRGSRGPKLRRIAPRDAEGERRPRPGGAGDPRRDHRSRGNRKGPEEPTRHVGLDAIAAVSVARPLRADALR